LIVEDFDEEEPSRQSLQDKFKDSKIEKVYGGDTQDIEEDLQNLQIELKKEKASPSKDQAKGRFGLKKPMEMKQQ